MPTQTYESSGCWKIPDCVNFPIQITVEPPQKSPQLQELYIDKETIDIMANWDNEPTMVGTSKLWLSPEALEDFKQCISPPYYEGYEEDVKKIFEGIDITPYPSSIKRPRFNEDGQNSERCR